MDGKRCFGLGELKSFGSKAQGLQLSVQVPEMRQLTGFCEISAAEVLAAMERLTDFFLLSEKQQISTGIETRSPRSA